MAYPLEVTVMGRFRVLAAGAPDTVAEIVTFPLPSGMLARVAVLGPMRMHYEKAMSAVLHIGRAFESLPV